VKRLIFLFTLVLLTVSCEKSKTVNTEIPYWVEERINHDEEIIKSDPKSGLDIAAWMRYEYKSKFYFEYLNLLSSSGPEIYQYDGTRFDNIDIDIFDYQSKKCCRYYIWKGPSYTDIYD
jgi:hypothetical protein